MDELYQLMFPGVRCSLDLDLSLLPVVFSLILTVASRLLHLYSTDDKTSRLMMKSFCIVRDTQRGTQSYMQKIREEKREKGDRGDQEEKRRIKRGESKLAVITSLCALLSLDRSKMFTELHRGEEGGRRQRWPGG